MPKATHAELAHLAVPVSDLPALAWVAPEACSRELVTEVRNIHSVKPDGGLWLSPLLDYAAGTEWTYFLETEAMCLITDADAYLMQEVKLAPEARVLRIDSWEDFAETLSAYLLLRPDHEMLSDFLCVQHLDFERMSKDWDAIYLTHEGQAATRYGEEGRYTSRGPNLYGWDLASVLILDVEAVADFGTPEPFKLLPEPYDWEDVYGDCEV